jgi:o-succinylbenzoate synthase
VKIAQLDLVRVELPLVRPFRTSFGIQSKRDVLLVRITTDDGVEGWGEDVAGVEPLYTSEFVAASHQAIQDHLAWRLLQAADIEPGDVANLLSPVKGWAMAKCALEAAVLDATLRSKHQSLATFLGATATSIAPGVSVGLNKTIAATVGEVEGYLAEGYVRVKLKIEPGRDIDLVRAVRQAFGDDVLLQVDANAAYTLDDAEHLRRLDEFGLLLIEQPLADDDLWRHAQLAKQVATPICLDESITSARIAIDAIEMGSCSIINIKPGRVGGYLEAKRIHDVCVERNVAAWCGGMLETGIGRAANLALCGLPGFTLPPDLSASNRYFEVDITEPIVMRNGTIDVPTGEGIGMIPVAGRLDELGAQWTATGAP